MNGLTEPDGSPLAELPVAGIAWLSAAAHTAAILVHGCAFGALDTLALAFVVVLPIGIARELPRLRRSRASAPSLGRTPYRDVGA